MFKYAMPLCSLKGADTVYLLKEPAQELWATAKAQFGILWELDTSLLVFALVLIVLVFLTGYVVSRSTDTTRSPCPMQTAMATDAMISVFPPARYSHPCQYETLIDFKIDYKTSTITINARHLLHKLASDDVEAKDDQVMLDLFCNRLQVYGWKIALVLDPWWKIRSLYYVVVTALSAKSNLVDVKGRSLDLDYVLPTEVTFVLRKFLANKAGDSDLTIELTCMAPSIHILDSKHGLCALLFLLRRDPVAGPKKTFMILWTQPKGLFKMIYSLMGRMQRHTVANTSEKQVNLLEMAEHDLTFKHNIRSEFIANHGLKAWRERRVHLAWEANLFKAGVLQRWEVTLYREAVKG